MARNSTKRLVAIWSLENPLFPVHRQHRNKTSTPQASTNVVLRFFERGGGFIVHCNTVLLYTT